MIRVILIFTILSINQILLSQSLTKLFKSELPGNIFQDKSTINSIDDNLEYLVSIHPHLLFYYFDYLDKFLGNRILDPNLNGANKLKLAREFYSKKRNDWAEKNIGMIQKRIDSGLKRDIMINEFEVFRYEPSDLKENFTFNNNQIEFYTFKFYSSDVYLIYDQSIDYKKLNINYFKKKNEEINLAIKNFDYLNENQYLQILNEIKQMWFISNDYKEIDNLDLFIREPYQLAINFYSDKFHENNNLFFLIESNLALFGYERLHQNLLYSDYVLPTFLNPMTYEINVNITSTPLFTLGLGYKFKLKEELGYFSYLKTSFSYTYLLNNIKIDSKGEEFYRFTYHVISGSSIEQYVYYIKDINNLNNHIISFNISSPVYYINNKLWFDLDLGVNYQIFNFDINVYRDLERTTNNVSEIFGVEQRGNKYKEDKIVVVPTISIKYQLANNFTLNLSAIGDLVYPRLGLGCQFNL